MIELPKPIHATVRDGQIFLEFPAQASLQVFAGFFWRRLYSGDAWNKLGTRILPPNISLSVPVSGRYRLYMGNRWYPLETATPKSRIEWFPKDTSKSLLVSFSIHAITLLTLGIISSLHWVSETIPVGEEPKPFTRSRVGSDGGASATGQSVPEHKLFQGISYWKFGKTQSENALTSLTESLSRIDGIQVKIAGSGENTHKVGSLLQGRGIGKGIDFGKGFGGFGTGGTGSGVSLENETNNFSDKDRRLVEQKFQELALELQRVHNSILIREPSFNVRLVFQTKVLPSGLLELISNNTSGKYSNASLNELMGVMKQKTQQIFVGKHLAGLVFRSETIFAP